MSITPAFLDELRTRVPISEVVGRFVTWDQKKSQAAKGDYWAPCPFHSEKTASFHVDDTKGFYYCFGCHEKGDAINFLKEQANMSFVEAVAEIASMAGVEMPKMRPQDIEKRDQNARLIEMHDAAARFFTLQLASSAGTLARNYLREDRKMTADTLREFGVGFAPNARDGLCRHLKDSGYGDDEILTGGLAVKPEDGRESFDRFRNRIMFPIHDARGRVVAFGGRALEKNARAKYLNSSDSPIFHKSRIVYNLHRARNHVKGQQHLILVEGYMDVIALAQAGFPYAVAPMGTAITLDQLDMIWRIDSIPTIALDGDQAGMRAAERLLDLSISRLDADRSLKFVQIPEGFDPDDYIQKKGANAFKKLLHDDALPTVDMLWQSATRDMDFQTPEGRTQFDRKLKSILKNISDETLRSHYREDFIGRRKVLFARPNGQNQNAQFRSEKRSFVRRENVPAKNSVLVKQQQVEVHRNLILTLMVLKKHPALARSYVEDLSMMSSQNEALDNLRRAVVRSLGDEDAVQNAMLNFDWESLHDYKLLRSLKMMRVEAEEADVLLRNELTRSSVLLKLDQEIELIQEKMRGDGSKEEMNQQLGKFIAERERLSKINDLAIDGAEDARQFLERYLESESWRK